MSALPPTSQLMGHLEAAFIYRSETTVIPVALRVSRGQLLPTLATTWARAQGSGAEGSTLQMIVLGGL
jgi:hypothetical protein